MDADFVARKLTELRMQKGVSEYKMSLDMGHSRSYIQNITSGHSNPALSEFLYMCEYLGVTPSAFFEEQTKQPILVQQIMEGIRKLGEEDLRAVLGIVERLGAKNE